MFVYAISVTLVFRSVELIDQASVVHVGIS